VETRVPREKPLQAKLIPDYFSLTLFFYLECLKTRKTLRELRLPSQDCNVLPKKKLSSFIVGIVIDEEKTFKFTVSNRNG
jgi:hypothetical protein